MRSRDAVTIPNLSAAREAAAADDPRITRASVAAVLGVAERTVRRWEDGDFIALRHALNLEKIYNTTFPEIRQRPTSAIAQTEKEHGASAGPKPEPMARDLAVQITALYNLRAAQGAKLTELRRLRDSSIQAIKTVLFRGVQKDPVFQQHLAEETFKRYTKQPPRDGPSRRKASGSA